MIRWSSSLRDQGRKKGGFEEEGGGAGTICEGGCKKDAKKGNWGSYASELFDDLAIFVVIFVVASFFGA